MVEVFCPNKYKKYWLYFFYQKIDFIISININLDIITLYSNIYLLKMINAIFGFGDNNDSKNNNEDVSDGESDNESDNESDAGGEKKINPAGKKMKIGDDALDSDVESNDDTDDDDDTDNDDDVNDNDNVDEHNEDAAGVNPPLFNSFDDEDDDDDNDDADDNYLQKFDKETQQKIIADYHPELQSHNYDEIGLLSTVVRDPDGNIIDPLHKTLPFITRYEKARILGERAKQINSGGKPFVEIDHTVIDGYLIALKEFEEKKIPYIIKRPLPNGGVEYWKFADLDFLA